MARFKKIYKNEKYELDRKRERIRKTVMFSFAGAMIACTAVAGCFQDNNFVVDVMFMIMGLLCFGYARFLNYIKKHGWTIFTVWISSKESYERKYLNKKEHEEDVKAIILVRKIEFAIWSLSSVVLPILGFLRLYSVI